MHRCLTSPSLLPNSLALLWSQRQRFTATYTSYWARYKADHPVDTIEKFLLLIAKRQGRRPRPNRYVLVSEDFQTATMCESLDMKMRLNKRVGQFHSNRRMQFREICLSICLPFGLPDSCRIVSLALARL